MSTKSRIALESGAVITGRRLSLTCGDYSVLSYDVVSSLISLADNLVGTAYEQTLGFGYTPAGQIASNTRSNDAYAWTGHYNLNRGYTANGRNQYTAVASITPTYDAKGNLTSAGSAAFAYTSENLLTSATGGIALAYDPALRLYQTSGGSAGTTRFGYDGTALIAEYNGSNAMLRRYVHGPGTDEPLAWYEGSGTTDRRFLHADERGSVVAVTNSAGTTLNVNGYDEYGIPSSGNAGRFQYTGQTWLPELGMYYYKARIYSPTLGRFLQTDPIGYGDGMNMYRYVGGDPVNFTDPSGLCGAGMVRMKDHIGTPATGDGTDIIIQGRFFCQRLPSPEGGGSSIGGGGRPRTNPSPSAPPPSPPDYCEIGNRIMYISDKTGEASLHLTAAGLFVAVTGAVTGNGLAIAGGAALTQTGNILGIGSGVLQTIGGVAQGVGGGGYKNATAGAVNIGTGAVISRGLRATIPRGWHNGARSAAEQNNDFIGNAISTLQGLNNWLAPTQAACPRR